MTSNPTLHIHPNPPIDINDLTDAMTVIAAGIGWPLIKHTVKRMKPDQNIGLLATLIAEGATGIEYLTASDSPTYSKNAYFLNTRGHIESILDDLPRSVWNRVCDLLHDGRPDAALRVIQAHHNVVKSLSNTESWTGNIPASDYTGARFVSLSEVTMPRDGYTYIKKGSRWYGPVPVNELDPPMVHVKPYDVTYS